MTGIQKFKSVQSQSAAGLNAGAGLNLSVSSKTVVELDQKAVKVAGEYKRCEEALLDVIMNLDQSKIFYQLGYRSLMDYAVQRLKLSEAVAAVFINVARKSREVPELKKKIMNGDLSVYKAKKITSILNKNNKDRWIRLAETQSARKVEREVALQSPKNSVKETLNYVSANKEIAEKVTIKRGARLQLQVGVSEKLMLKLRRAQSIAARKNRGKVGLEELLSDLVEMYLNKNDPVRKAQRQELRGKLMDEKSQHRKLVKAPSKKGLRKPIPAKLRHQVLLRDNGRCTFMDAKGKRCQTSSFLEFHHIKPVSEGGEDSLDNLRLLCSGHHKVMHCS